MLRMNEVIKPGSQARVIQAWKITYRDPLILHVGETLQVGKRDSEWSGWIGARTLLEKAVGFQNATWVRSMKANRLPGQRGLTTPSSWK